MIVVATTPGGGPRNSPHPMKGGLSLSRQRLVELMQDVNFGRMERLTIRNGEPLWDPTPVIVREIKFGGYNGPRPELHCPDFPLKSQVIELFQYFDQVPNCLIEPLEIKHGLPFRMFVREEAA